MDKYTTIKLFKDSSTLSSETANSTIEKELNMEDVNKAYSLEYFRLIINIDKSREFEFLCFIPSNDGSSSENKDESPTKLWLGKKPNSNPSDTDMKLVISMQDNKENEFFLSAFDFDPVDQQGKETHIRAEGTYTATIYHG